MKYTVKNRPGRLVLMLACMTVFCALLVGTLLLFSMPNNETVQTKTVMLGAEVLFILLCAVGIRRSVRLRITVDGDRIEYYPLRGGKQSLNISDITRFRTGAANETGVPVFGILGYAATGGTYGNGAVSYLFYSGDKEVLRFSSGMINAERLKNELVGRINAGQPDE